MLVSELSGRSNIVGPDRRGTTSTHDPKLMDQILAKVVSMENAGYQFEAADGSFDLLVQQVHGHVPARISSGCSYHVNVENERRRRDHAPRPR